MNKESTEEQIYNEYMKISKKFLKKLNLDFKKIVKEQITNIKNYISSDYLLDQEISQTMVLYLIDASLYRLYADLVWEDKLGLEYELEEKITWNEIQKRILDMKKLINKDNIILYIYTNFQHQQENKMVCYIYDISEKYILENINNILQGGERKCKLSIQKINTISH